MSIGLALELVLALAACVALVVDAVRVVCAIKAGGGLEEFEKGGWWGSNSVFYFLGAAVLGMILGERLGGANEGVDVYDSVLTCIPPSIFVSFVEFHLSKFSPSSARAIRILCAVFVSLLAVLMGALK